MSLPHTDALVITLTIVNHNTHRILVDPPSAYNAIIGRANLDELKFVTSTTHLKIKFPTEEGVGEVRGTIGSLDSAITRH